jgi:hypothetical protein
MRHSAAAAAAAAAAATTTTSSSFLDASAAVADVVWHIDLSARLLPYPPPPLAHHGARVRYAAVQRRVGRS